jgi:cytochrome c-type biogenesis protein CcsB
MKIEVIIIAAGCLYVLSTVCYVVGLIVNRKVVQNGGYVLLMGGFLCHLAMIFHGFVKSGSLPVHNFHQVLSLAGCALVAAFFVCRLKLDLRILGVYVAPLAALIMIVVSLLPSEPVQVNRILNSAWLVVHIIMIFAGEACFALACGVGLLYLMQEHAIKTKSHGFVYRRLPSLDLLDTAGYACMAVGFALLTMGLLTGFVYARMVWGRFWSWDPKEVWSAITWLLYAALLHGRVTVGWRGRRSAVMAIIGFGVVIFTFLGVNFFLQGHHGEFTRF